MKIKNLFERMKPELMEKFKIEEAKYPAIAKSIKEDLEKNYFIMHIKYGTVLDIESLLDTGSNFTRSKVYDMFEEMDMTAFHGQKGENQ